MSLIQKAIDKYEFKKQNVSIEEITEVSLSFTKKNIYVRIYAGMWKTNRDMIKFAINKAYKDEWIEEISNFYKSTNVFKQ